MAGRFRAGSRNEPVKSGSPANPPRSTVRPASYAAPRSPSPLTGVGCQAPGKSGVAAVGNAGHFASWNLPPAVDALRFRGDSGRVAPPGSSAPGCGRLSSLAGFEGRNPGRTTTATAHTLTAATIAGRFLLRGVGEEFIGVVGGASRLEKSRPIHMCQNRPDWLSDSEFSELHFRSSAISWIRRDPLRARSQSGASSAGTPTREGPSTWPLLVPPGTREIQTHAVHGEEGSANRKPRCE